MSTSEPPRHPLNEQERQRVVELLCDAYASDQLEMEEFERRLDQANRAGSGAELAGLLSDIRVASAVVSTSPEGRGGKGGAVTQRDGGDVGWHVADSARIPERQFHLAIWSARVRKGNWVPARQMTALAFMGGVELDFREAVFGPQGVDVTAFAVMGSVEIIVPPGIHVETNGFALMGGFEDVLMGAGVAGPDAPTLRISGMALMGGVEVSVRQPGESRTQSERRLKAERKRALTSGDST